MVTIMKPDKPLETAALLHNLKVLYNNGAGKIEEDDIRTRIMLEEVIPAIERLLRLESIGIYDVNHGGTV